MILVEFGKYDEIIVAVESIRVIQGVPDYDRAGQPIMEIVRGTRDDVRPRWVASTLTFDQGATISVPHPPAEVMRRIVQADREAAGLDG